MAEAEQEAFKWKCDDGFQNRLPDGNDLYPW